MLFRSNSQNNNLLDVVLDTPGSVAPCQYHATNPVPIGTCQMFFQNADGFCRYEDFDAGATIAATGLDQLGGTLDRRVFGGGVCTLVQQMRFTLTRQ